MSPVTNTLDMHINFPTNCTSAHGRHAPPAFQQSGASGAAATNRPVKKRVIYMAYLNKMLFKFEQYRFCAWSIRARLQKNITDIN